MPFGQLVLGSPGSGKSTYCDGSKFAPPHAAVTSSLGPPRVADSS